MNKKQLLLYRKYLTVVGLCGGAATLADLPRLMNLYYAAEIKNGATKEFKYDKIAYDLRIIDKLHDSGDLEWFSVYTSSVKNVKTGKPLNSRFIVLTSKGWYEYDKKARDELNIANEDTQRKVKFVAYRNVYLRDIHSKHKVISAAIVDNYEHIKQVYINKDGSHIKGIVSVPKFITDDILIEEMKIDTCTDKTYVMKIMYFRDKLSYSQLSRTLDKMLAILEREQHLGEIPSDFKIKLKVSCINTIPGNVKKCIKYINKYKRHYAYFASVHQNNHTSFNETTLEKYMSNKIIDRIDFFYLTENFEIYKY